MAIVNKNILLLGVVKFELQASSGKGWIISSIEDSTNTTLEHLPTSQNSINLIGDFNVSAEQNISMNLICNNEKDIAKLKYLLSTLTLIDTVGAVATSWNNNKILQSAKNIQNYLLLPSLVCNYYANSKSYNSFFFKLLTSCSISPYEEGSNEVYSINLTFTSKFINEEANATAPEQSGTYVIQG